MIGSMLAGTDEAPGEVIIFEGRKFKTYRGMGSLEAMEDGSKDRYFQDAEDDIKKLVPEGIVGRVPFKGSVSEIIYQMVGGLKAGMGYCGAKNITEMQKARFVKITAAGVKKVIHTILLSRRKLQTIARSKQHPQFIIINYSFVEIQKAQYDLY
jgi:IMP dehydrogenase